MNLSISYNFHCVHIVLNLTDSIHYLFSEDLNVRLDQPHSRGMMPWGAEQSYSDRNVEKIGPIM